MDEPTHVEAYVVVFGPAPDGSGTWSAWSPDLSGCVAAGDTYEQVEVLIRGAIAFHISGLRESAYPVPSPSSRAANVAVPAVDAAA